MRGDKTHYVPRERADKALKEDGCILTPKIDSACGRDAYMFSVNWDTVDCKLCLRKRTRELPARKEGQDD